ncbi:Crp/Fnr family transcriptional regulator [Sanyastnella coralliicola]|uniref:Crp/Fnr family transcriptional regulator n=1 Tax=Sanyastnella coralliicola TaxID=3069118 RepID=UPI0027B973D5|nr:Crp/Fnr family transcriptional regulator [Longitalea sp. SCSIO 12813]
MIEVIPEDVKQKFESEFKHFSPDLKSFLTEVGLAKEFREGEEMMRTGQYFKHTMLVVDGKVKLYREDEEGNEFLLYYLEPGSACALSMICATRAEQSQVKAVAVEDVTALAIPIQYMDQLMTDHKSWYYFVLETYRSRFEELLTVIDQVAFRSMDEKLLFYLRRQFKAYQSDTIQTTHQQIAYDLNSSREVISRLLKKMEQKGFVALHRNAIERKNLDQDQFPW